MAQQQYVIGAYCFETKAEYDRALKEKETITYIRENTNHDSIKEILKIYNKSIEKSSFQTIFGYMYLDELRERLIKEGGLSEENLTPIPMKAPKAEAGGKLSTDESARQIRKYKLLYEHGKDNAKIYKMAVVFLILMIVAMVVITYRSKYSVFTYFTDYENKIRTEVEDEYMYWQTELEKREEAVSQKEEELGIEHDTGEANDSAAE